jgi:hypothetical protein
MIGSVLDGPAPLDFILEMASARKELRKTRDPEQTWSDQEYINFACLQDPNRFMEIDKQSLYVEDGETLVDMRVDTFLLPSSLTLEDVAEKKTKLKAIGTG